MKISMHFHHRHKFFERFALELIFDTKIPSDFMLFYRFHSPAIYVEFVVQDVQYQYFPFGSYRTLKCNGGKFMTSG